MKKIALLTVITLTCYFQGLSQERCATVQYTNLLEDRGLIKPQQSQFEEHISQSLVQRRLFQNSVTTGTYKIPVVVHVIHNGEAIGTGTNISDAQILSQIDVLNKDFQRLNADASNTPASFAPLAASLNIEFKLARQTPDGLPTSGIVRVNGHRSQWPAFLDADHDNIEDYKELSYWPSTDYLNVWVINMSSYYGYAQFPVANLAGLEDYLDGMATTDGVVILYTCFGTSDAGSFNLIPALNKGRTLTHEVGHFFGLRHIWGDDSGCSGSDYVSDTPNQSIATESICPSTVLTDACSPSVPGIMYQNYMDYTNDACMNLFTAGQADRMKVVLESLTIPRRRSLWETSQGLAVPDCGANPPVDVALVSIDQPGPVTCFGTMPLRITLENRGCPTVTSIRVDYQINNQPIQSVYAGDFELTPDAPASLTVGSLNLNPGNNTLTVTIALVNGENDNTPADNTQTTNRIVNVATDILPLRENFEALSESWSIVSPQPGITWEVSAATAAFGQSAKFPAFSAGTTGQESWIVSPVLDLSQQSEASLFYDVSYAWNGFNNDQFIIMASTNCGNTYTLQLLQRSGAQLATSNSDAEWIPANTGQWSTRNYLNLSTLAGHDSVRLAFISRNERGNNIYLDNLDFYISNDSDPLLIDNAVAIYRTGPDENSVTFNLPERSAVNLLLTDALGRTVEQAVLPDVLNQTYAFQASIPAGLYILRLQTRRHTYVQKIYYTR